MKKILYWSLLSWPLVAGAQVTEPRAVFGAGGGPATGGSYTLTDTTGQPSVGPASSAAYAVVDGFWPEPGETPVAATNFNLGSKAGQSLTLSLAKLLLLATDPNGETLSAVSVNGSSASGGTVTLGAGGITYTPINGFMGADTITYVLADPGGDTVTGTINVLVTDSSLGSFNHLSAVALGGGQLQIKFLGIPGTNYIMEVTHDLSPPITWSPLVTNVAAANGLLVFTNTPTGNQSYYRTRWAQ